MKKERFALKKRKYLSEILKALNISNKIEIKGLARLGFSQPNDVCFCDRLPSDELEVAPKTLIFCTDFLLAPLKERFLDAECIAVPDPRATFIDLGYQLLEDELIDVSSEMPRPFGIHPNAKISKTAVIHHETRIEDNVIIGENCVIHRGTWIQANTVIRDNTVIGTEGINAYRGQDGRMRSFPHFAGVFIGENVEIGANSVIVRGIVNSTQIGSYSIIGNLSNIGHGVEIAERVWMSVGCLIGGHSQIGTGATLGMGVSVKDNTNIGESAQIGMGSVVTKAIADNTSVFGNPARIVRGIQAGPKR